MKIADILVSGKRSLGYFPPAWNLRTVSAFGVSFLLKSTAVVSKRLSEKFGKLWLAAEVVLFVLVGAAVDIRYTLSAGMAAVLLIMQK